MLGADDCHSSEYDLGYCASPNATLALLSLVRPVSLANLPNDSAKREISRSSVVDLRGEVPHQGCTSRLMGPHAQATLHAAGIGRPPQRKGE